MDEPAADHQPASGAGARLGSADGDLLARAFEWQANHCERAGAPITARVIRGAIGLAGGATRTGRIMAGWPGDGLEDALPLRIAAGLHHLHLSGAAREIAPVYTGETIEPGAIAAIIARIAEGHDEALATWLASPPQTNEAGRSAGVVAGLLWLARRLGPRFTLFEIGASAGINTMLARYRYRLGAITSGPADSPMVIAPEWRGPSPPGARLEIGRVEGCDIAPVDLGDQAQAQRLRAYVWADAKERMTRLETAIAMARTAPPALVACDAADFVRRCLARAQPPGTARVLFHTVMWQYLAPGARAQISAMMAQAGGQATRQSPLAWIRLEANRAAMCHELQVHWWAGAAETAPGWLTLATAHPHGAWIEWRQD